MKRNSARRACRTSAMSPRMSGPALPPATNEVADPRAKIDVKTKKIVYALKDEKGREVHSEKMVEIHFEDGKPVKVGDQFGVGRAR